MKKKRKLGRKLLTFLLTLAMVVGFMPGMGVTAHAANGPSVTVSPDGGGTVSSSYDSSQNKWTLTAVPAEGYSFEKWTYNYIGDSWEYNRNPFIVNDQCTNITVFFKLCRVTGVTLNKTSATIAVGGRETLTATVAPNNAADKTVKWSVGGTDTGAVKLYTDEACTTEVGANATETLTVYAKGISAGSATITVTTNDGAKTASCAVTVSKANAVAATVTANNRTYDGTEKPLVTVTGEVTGGKMQYALGTATEATQTYTTSIPTATDAGTYYVWYKAKGDDSHTDSEPACITVTIDEQKQNKDEDGETQQNPDGTKTVTKETADGNTILVTNYSQTDEQISQFVFKKANGSKLNLESINSNNLKTIVVPGAVTANGKTYKVTRVRKGFLKNCKKATKVDFGKNINTFDKNAFKYGKKIKKIVIRGKLKKVGKGAFKAVKKKVVIKIKTSEKTFEKNKKLLEKSGLPKNVVIKKG